ncbi:heme ABC transporter permease [Roseibium sp. SCP14]|uniref:heme ABC transporter permease n=1 Tax=Roseibium sp. SCP14 TaxID=3141375 RepID=UPI0033371DA2
MAFWDYANPTRFLRLVQVVLPWLIGLCIIAFAAGLYMAFFTAPQDYQQGNTVRIMYIHVPAAWLCMMCYSIMSISSIGTLVWKHPLADVSAKAAAPIGAAFTFMALVTGSLWGKPMWGTYWVWDARLTSVLVLLIMYLGLMTLWRTMDDPIKAGKAAAVLTLVGALNLPVIKFSVDWWNTLHQPASVVRMDGPTIHPDILWPLLMMALAFTLLFFVLHLMAMRNEILRRRVRALRLRAASVSHPGTAAATAQPAE